MSPDVKSTQSKYKTDTRNTCPHVKITLIGMVRVLRSISVGRHCPQLTSIKMTLDCFHFIGISIEVFIVKYLFDHDHSGSKV